MKNTKTVLTGRLLGAAIATAALITPSLAFAQDYPAYADQGGSQQIQGTVAAINGTWNITVQDANGYADSVALHQGTIINPTGLTLEPGMSVTIDGYADGPNFDAMEIDTPYQYQGPAPVAVYYGAGAWYPGYAYGWGPSFSLVFNLGNSSWQQRSFYAGGEVRRPEAPPSGWQNSPHGYIGNTAGFGRTVYAPPPSRSYVAPQRSAAPQYAAPRTYSAPPQQQRTYSAPPQQQRTYQAPLPQQRSFAAPAPQQRTFSAPAQQARSYSAPVARAAAPAPRASQPDERSHRGG